MPIHWFPGHMATARKEIRKALPTVDLLIEVLDARLPFSSENPLVAELRGRKPTIRILNKIDLADPATTEAWLVRLAETAEVRVIPHHRHATGLGETVRARAAEIVPPIRDRPMTAMILGIPNVGKSTVINTLAGRSIAKAEDRPAVTRLQQRVHVAPAPGGPRSETRVGLVLLDTPGFLWPKLSPEACGYRLAIAGAIPDNVVDYPDIALFAARFLLARHPGALMSTCGLTELPVTPTAAVEAIGRRRGFLQKGGVVDLQRASERLIHDLRAGTLGRISLETPEDCARR